MGHNLFEILEMQGPQLYGLVARVTLRWDVADDIIQEVFLKLSESEKFAQTSDPIGYIHATALNLAFDWRRSRTRVPEMTNMDLSLDYLQSDDPPALNQLIENEQLEQVLDAAAKLPRYLHEIFVMKYIEDNSYQTIADRLGRTPKQIRAVSHKAITQLRYLVNCHKANAAARKQNTQEDKASE